MTQNKFLILFEKCCLESLDICHVGGILRDVEKYILEFTLVKVIQRSNG